jgi:hypothetical protein
MASLQQFLSNSYCSAQRPHVIGLQHLADGNHRRAVKNLSKAIFFCHLHGLKWELVRAVDDLKVRSFAINLVLLRTTGSYPTACADAFYQHADASAVSAEEYAAIMTIPANFLEHPGSRPLILRLEVLLRRVVATCANVSRRDNFGCESISPAAPSSAFAQLLE